MITVNRSNGTSFSINDGEVVGPANWPVSGSKTSNPLQVISVTTNTVKVRGDYRYRFTSGFSFNLVGAGGNNGTYTLSTNSTFDDTYTTLTFSSSLTDLTQRGQVVYVVPSGEVESTLTLFGKSTMNIAQYVAQNVFNLTENFASATTPPDPIVGQLWFDTTSNALMLFDNSLSFNYVSEQAIPQTANTFFAGPTTGSPAGPTFRALVAADMPTSVVQSVSLATTGGLFGASNTFTVTSGAASGTLTLQTQAANLVFAGPGTGSATAPTFRNLVSLDLPLGTASVPGAVSASTGLSVTGGAVTVVYGTAVNTAAQGNDTRITGALQSANNLIDVANVVTARGNLVAAKSGANSDITSLSGLTTPLSVGQGGTGAATLTAHAVLLGNTTSTPNFATIGTSGALLIDKGAGIDPAFVAMSGDATITSAGVISVSKSAGTAFGTAAFQNTGTSGATLPFLNGTNAWSGTQTISVNGTIGNSSQLILNSTVGTANQKNFALTQTGGGFSLTPRTDAGVNSTTDYFKFLYDATGDTLVGFEYKDSTGQDLSVGAVGANASGADINWTAAPDSAPALMITDTGSTGAAAFTGYQLGGTIGAAAEYDYIGATAPGWTGGAWFTGGPTGAGVFVGSGSQVLNSGNSPVSIGSNGIEMARFDQVNGTILLRNGATPTTVFSSVLSGSTFTTIVGVTGGTNVVNLIGNSVEVNGTPFVASATTDTTNATNITTGTLAFARLPFIPRTTVADVNYTASTSDYLIAYTTLTAARTVTLPAPTGPTAEQIYIVKDETGNAGSFNITVAGTSGTIDGAANKVISTNYGSLKVYHNGSNYFTVD